MKRAREKALLCQISRLIRKLQYLIHSGIGSEIDRQMQPSRKSSETDLCVYRDPIYDRSSIAIQ